MIFNFCRKKHPKINNFIYFTFNNNFILLDKLILVYLKNINSI